jgi:hypothetical protein
VSDPLPVAISALVVVDLELCWLNAARLAASIASHTLTWSSRQGTAFLSEMSAQDT